jgi:hypothetical protein
MNTATDDPGEEVERNLALLDLPQPLGVLPTRQFWRDPENRRLAGPPFAIGLAALMLVVNLLLDPPWWAAALATAACMLVMLGFLERYIRYAAKRRFRSRADPPALAGDDSQVAGVERGADINRQLGTRG